MVIDHITIGFIGDGEKMRWHFVTSFADVHFTHAFGVNGQAFVRIDDDAEKSRVGLNDGG